MFERFTDRARKVFALANQEAQRFNHDYIDEFHIFLGLIKEGSGVAATIIKNQGLDLRKIRLEVEEKVGIGKEMVTMGKLPQTPKTKLVIENAIEESRNLNHNYIGTEHLFLGLLKVEGISKNIFRNLDLDVEKARSFVVAFLQNADSCNCNKNDGFPYRQDIKWSNPSAIELIIDLYEQYYKTNSKTCSLTIEQTIQKARQQLKALIQFRENVKKHYDDSLGETG